MGRACLRNRSSPCSLARNVGKSGATGSGLEAAMTLPRPSCRWRPRGREAGAPLEVAQAGSVELRSNTAVGRWIASAWWRALTATLVIFFSGDALGLPWRPWGRYRGGGRGVLGRLAKGFLRSDSRIRMWNRGRGDLTTCRPSWGAFARVCKKAAFQVPRPLSS